MSLPNNALPYQPMLHRRQLCAAFRHCHTNPPRDSLAAVSGIRPHLKRRHAFTVVELLIVAGLVALLLALSVPLFSSMRQRTDAAACNANFRSVSRALQHYVADHDGRLPGPLYQGQGQLYRVAGTVDYQLATAVSDYLSLSPPTKGEKYERIADAFACPAWRKATGLANGHIYALQIVPSQSPPFGNPNGATPLKPQKITAVLSPATTWAMVEMDWRLFSGASSYNGKETVAPRPVHGSIRHLLFFDGHVEAQPSGLKY